jgi:PAS domain S-box-containing protein
VENTNSATSLGKESNTNRIWMLSAIGLIVSFSISTYLYFALKHEGENEEEMRVVKTVAILQEKLNSYIGGLQGMAGIFTVSNYAPSEAMVVKYSEARDYFSNFEGALGFGFIREVLRSDLGEYVKNHQKETPNFAVSNISSLNPYPNNRALVIEHIEPMSRNRRARGLNIASENVRYEAALRAKVSGKPALTGVVQLVQADSKVSGFLFFLPIYRSGIVPVSIEEREQKFVGFAYAPLLADELVKYVLGIASSDLDVLIVDSTDSANPSLVFSNLPLESQPIDNANAVVVSAGGRSWTVYGKLRNPLLHHRFPFLTACIAFVLMTAVWAEIVRVAYRSNVQRIGAENRSAELASWNQGILAGTNLAMISLEASKKIRTINPAARSILGVDQDTNIELVFDEILNVPNASTLKQELVRAFSEIDRDQRHIVVESSVRRADEVEIPVRFAIAPVLDVEGKVNGYLIVVDDLTHARAQAADLIERSKIISLGEMAGGIAHEINNPLAIIIGRASLLLRDGRIDQMSHADFRHEIEKFKSVSDRIAKITKGLRSFARDGGGDSVDPVQVSKLVQDALDFCEQQMKSSGIELQLVGDLDIEIDCRATQITQVLLNLFNNSIYELQGQSSKWIRVETFSSESEIQLLITDSGNGIAPEVLKKIMMPFYTTKPQGKGTGLGLSVSQGIVEAHGGELYYNRSCVNTQFVIKLPRKRLAALSESSPRKVA